MKTINLLIVASSDMDGSVDDYNLPNDVLNITSTKTKKNITNKHKTHKRTKSIS